MPVYQFQCKTCKFEFEIKKQKPLSMKKQVCRKCGAPASRVWNTPVVHFKGNGFYINDKKDDK